MFPTQAWAEAPGAVAPEAAPRADPFLSIVPFILIFAIMYFLLIRPQQRRMKEHQSMLAAVKKGDRVILGGGLIGTVTKVLADDQLQVELADGVRVRALRSGLSGLHKAAAGRASASRSDPAETAGDDEDDPGAVSLDKPAR